MGRQHPVYENFLIFHTRDLEIYLTNPPETCSRVSPYALVRAKTFWGIGVAFRAFEQRWSRKIDENQQKFDLPDERKNRFFQFFPPLQN